MIKFDKNYYQDLMNKNGYNPFEFGFFDFNLGKLAAEELQLKFLCHQDVETFVKNIEKGEKSIITTGFGMSGVPHIGTISQLIRILKLNKAGIDTQIVLGDLDAYCGKNIPFNKTIEYKDKYLNFLKKIGYQNSVGSIVRGQYGHEEVLNTSYLAGSYMNEDLFREAEEDLHNFYVKNRKVDKNMSYRRKTSLSLMIADFLNLGIKNKYSFNKQYNNIAVMLGIDEHQYVRFGQKTLQSIKNDAFGSSYFNSNITLSSIYTPIIKGFNNFPKQSKSFPLSSINAHSSSEDIYNKIITKEGDYYSPENNVVYQMMTGCGNYSIDEYKVLYHMCKKGDAKRINAKKEFADYIIDILSKRED